MEKQYRVRIKYFDGSVYTARNITAKNTEQARKKAEKRHLDDTRNAAEIQSIGVKELVAIK